MNQYTLEKIAVIVECSDGAVRQVYLSKDENDCITGVIKTLHEGTIKVLSEPLSLTLTPNTDEKAG